MKTHDLTLSLILVLTLFSLAQGQSTKSKIELGVQGTSLTVFPPDVFGDVTQLGIGGRATYNFNNVIAADGEINFFPQKGGFFLGQGRGFQGQFGVKAGKRFEKFGLFAKARPGFLSIGNAFFLEEGATLVFNGFTQPNARIARRTFFTTDIGGVLEFYPTNRATVRFDAGDTIVRYPKMFSYDVLNFPALVETRPVTYQHNFQFTAGVSFRLDDPGHTTTSTSSLSTPTFEVGAQFTSLLVDPPTQVCGACGVISFATIVHAEPGFGGRFTFNLTDSIGLEAEGNFFTRDHSPFFEPGGHLVQGQFGVKAGKRLERFGFFGKARPGFVAFTEATELVGTHTQPFGNITITVGDFRNGTKFYPSIDVGGVVEFYVSRRWMARMDFGDTIVRYGEYAVGGFIASQAIVRRPPETRHNFQFTSGIGFRF